MHWLTRFFNGRSGSRFVQNEVLQKLPREILIQFLSEFDDEGNPIIFINSPEHEGIISEARTREEAILNAQDAILTFFDVPRSCANLIEFQVEEVPPKSVDSEERSRVRMQSFRIRMPMHA